MAVLIVVARTTDLRGGDVAGECDVGSPGSGGASPYPELRPTCAGATYVNLPVILALMMDKPLG